jgi:host factor-I protein
MIGFVYPNYKKEGIHMSETINLQDAILKEVRRDKVPVTLFLMNGFQLRGIITGFDSFVVVLVTDGKQQMIYKHAISTLAPIRPLKAAAPTA